MNPQRDVVLRFLGGTLLILAGAWLLSVALTGCGGAVERDEPPQRSVAPESAPGDAGPDVAPDAGEDASSGCYASQLRCGSFVGRWCWTRASLPNDVPPADGCTRFSPLDNGYADWCCP